MLKRTKEVLMKKTYVFLGCSLFDLFRSFYGGTLFIFLILFAIPGIDTDFFKSYWLWIILGNGLLHMLFLISRLGWIRILRKEGNPVIEIQSLLLKENFMTPVDIDYWWNYDFEDPFMIEEDSAQSQLETGERMSYQGKIVIWLFFSNHQGQRLAFYEEITIGEKFPHGIPYRLRSVPEEYPQVMVQNINGVLDFLRGRDISLSLPLKT